MDNIIAFSYRLGVSTVPTIVIETCAAIWTAFRDIWMPAPTHDDWIKIAKDFQEKWNFPNYLGALDGKHVVIQSPSNSGSQYYNYKGTFSTVLTALVDANYCFRIVDIGAFGRQSDGGIYASSNFGKAMDSGDMNITENAPLLGHNTPIPHVVVAGEVFPLKRYFMRPFPGRGLTNEQKVFNYRLSRARQIVENAFMPKMENISQAYHIGTY